MTGFGGGHVCDLGCKFGCTDESALPRVSSAPTPRVPWVQFTAWTGAPPANFDPGAHTLDLQVRQRVDKPATLHRDARAFAGDPS